MRINRDGFSPFKAIGSGTITLYQIVIKPENLSLYMNEMRIIDATIDWAKGEIFEAILTLVFGVVLIIIAMFLLKFATTQAAQALVIPLFCIGFIIGLPGAFNAYSNQKKMAQYQASYLKDTVAFVHSEKTRVEGFQSLYTYTKYLASGLFATSFIIFFFLQNKNWQALAIAMVILGLSGLDIDYFSKERADIYYQIIINQVQ